VWASGHVAQSLASEYIALLRALSLHSPAWNAALRQFVSSAAAALPSLLPSAEDGKSHEAFRLPLAALAVAGGFSEPLRVGGHVEIESDGGIKVLLLASQRFFFFFSLFPTEIVTS
jgi:hypothetical protein